MICVLHSFGNVYFGCWRLPTGEELEVAVKVSLESSLAA